MNSFRFAVMGAGNISNKFCDAVRRIEGCEVAAVASRSMQRASEFAARNQIAHTYDSYEEMLEKEKPDCVYIGTLPNTHFELTMLCLKHDVPVLCEKAMFLNEAQAETVFRESEKRQIFVMEALWSRFLPAVKRAKEWLLDGRIGVLSSCDTAISFVPPQDKENRYHNAALGGGAARDILVYAYELTTFMITAPIQEIQVSAVWEDTGVDLTDHVVLRFHDVIASLTASFAGPIEERMVLYGTEGKIVIPHPHYADEAFLYDQSGSLTEHFRDEITENGFVYETEEAMRCIRAGRIESSIVPHQSTLDCSKLFDLVDRTRKSE